MRYRRRRNYKIKQLLSLPREEKDRLLVKLYQENMILRQKNEKLADEILKVRQRFLNPEIFSDEPAKYVLARSHYPYVLDEDIAKTMATKWFAGPNLALTRCTPDDVNYYYRASWLLYFIDNIFNYANPVAELIHDINSILFIRTLACKALYNAEREYLVSTIEVGKSVFIEARKKRETWSRKLSSMFGGESGYEE